MCTRCWFFMRSVKGAQLVFFCTVQESNWSQGQRSYWCTFPTLWCLLMSFCRVTVRFCFCVTNHGLEITLFLLYIVNLSLMSTTALIFILTFCLKGVPGHFKKRTWLLCNAFKANTCGCLLWSDGILNHLPNARKLSRHRLCFSLLQWPINTLFDIERWAST